MLIDKAQSKMIAVRDKIISEMKAAELVRMAYIERV